MKPIKRILLVVHSEMKMSTGLRQARLLAERSGAQLQLLMCAFDPMIEISGSLAGERVQKLAKAQYLQQRSLWLDQLGAEWGREGLQVECEVLWTERAEEAVVARVLETQPDLVIKDLLPDPADMPEGAAQPAMLNATDWRLARLCPAPLLLLRQDRAGLPHRVAVAVDVGLDARQAAQPLNELLAKSALRLAIYADAETHAVYAFPYRRPTRRPTLVVGISASISRLYREVRDTAAENFRQFARAFSVPEERAHWLERQNEPAAALEQFAREQHIDLLVMGSSYHSTLERVLLGSVSEALLRRIPCDVLLIKPESFAAELGQHLDLETLHKRYDGGVAAVGAT